MLWLESLPATECKRLKRKTISSPLPNYCHSGQHNARVWAWGWRSHKLSSCSSDGRTGRDPEWHVGVQIKFQTPQCKVNNWRKILWLILENTGWVDKTVNENRHFKILWKLCMRGMLSAFFFFFFWYWSWTQGLACARQVFYPWAIFLVQGNYFDLN